MTPIFFTVGACTVLAVGQWCWCWRYPFRLILILNSWIAWWSTGRLRALSNGEMMKIPMSRFWHACQARKPARVEAGCNRNRVSGKNHTGLRVN